MILINPASRGSMGMISRYSAIGLPIGIGILAGYLLSKGKQAIVIDEQISPIDKYFFDNNDYFKNISKPYIFGIGCLTMNSGRGLEIARLLKSRYPDSRVILGGIHPTALPEEALSTGYVDVVVRGEGEETLLLLYDAIKNDKSCFDIEGISFIDGGNIKHNLGRVLIQDLDAVPRFPYELFNTSRYNLSFVTTSRGCPYNCIFCSQRLISERKYRFRSCEKIIEELDLLINKYGQKSLSFSDDDFLVNKKRVKLLCESIIQNKFNAKAKFGCQARVDNINEEILTYLRNAGFNFIGLGVETSSERLMRLLEKGTTVGKNIEAVKLIKKMGFSINASFLFGIPSETSKDRFEAYMLTKELKMDYVKFNNIVPYPGTKLLEMARNEGTLNISKNWKNFNSVEGVVEGLFSKTKLPYIPINTTEKELRKDLVRANLYFYLSNIPSLFAPREGNPGWFLLQKKWYFNPKEYYYLIKLALKVILNCIIVFDIKWIVRRRSESN